MTNNNILLIEDEPGLILTLIDRLNAEGYLVDSEKDGLLGEKRAETGSYDCILLDIMLPGRDGYQICRNLRDKGVTTPVLMLTARNTNLDTVLGLKLGADDYLAKPFDMSVLLARVEALVRRYNTKRAMGNSSELYFGEFVLDLNNKRLNRNGAAIQLSVQEYRVLEFLLKSPGKVVSRDELLDEVWGYQALTGTRTVDVHIASLRKKLGETDFPKHILTVRGFGYQFKY